MKTSRLPFVGLACALVAASATASAQDVDLLRAVDADVAVSSVYRDQAAQVGSLVDRDLATAWNSRTGELVGTWIDVRVPASATVTSIAMTAGFTHASTAGDLFVGNHRIARVRVSHDGTVVREQALDVEARTLQTIPIGAPGGVYRIEVLEVLPGSHATWRETCVSELRVMGTDPSARPGLRVPRTAVGALPGPRPPVPPPDRAAIARAHRQRVAAIERAWIALEQIADGGREGSAPPETWAGDATEIARTRRTVLRDTAAFVEPVDALAADALRAAALVSPPSDWSEWQHTPQLGGDLAALGTAMDTVSAFLADDEARCRWARALGHLHLVRLRSFTDGDREHADMDADRSVDALMRAADTLTSAEAEWSRNTRGVAARLGHLTLPAGARGAADLEALRAQIEVMRATCGWPAP